MAVKYDPILDALREADTSGSSDTASNLGTGTGVYSYKNSGIFYFNSLATSTTIGISGPTSGAISLDLLSIPSALIPDPLEVNNLSAHSNASINVLTATTGNITNINTDITNYNTSYTITGSEAIGSVYWNSDRDTVQVNTNAGTLDVGEITVFHCINQTGSTINKGTAVMFAGSLGASGKMKIAPAVADGTYQSIVVLGVTKENIADGDEGKVIFVGELKGIDTSVYGTAGQILYIDPTTPGAFTTTVPTAPNLKYPIAATLDSKSNGNIVVRAIFTPDLDELNDVQIGTLAGNDVLSYNSTNSRWENKSLATLKTDLDLSGTNTGDVTVTDSSTIDFTLTGQDITGSVIEGGITHNNLGSLQGGTAGEYNHLTNAELTAVQGLTTGYLKLDLTNTPLTGNTLNFDSTANKNVNVDRTNTAFNTGRTLTIQSGGARSGNANTAGGTLELKSGIATGNNSSDITFFTATAGSSGVVDRNPTQKMVIKGSGAVGIGQTSPAYTLDVTGTGRFTGNLIANNLSGINTGDAESPYFGDGLDAYINLDGVNQYPDMMTFDGVQTYTLIRDIYPITLAVGNPSTTIILETAGYRIIAYEEVGLYDQSIIRNNGTDANGRTNGNGATGGFYKAGTAGVIGLATATAGANGTAPITVSNIVGGLGGRGGSARATVATFEALQLNSSTGLVQPTTALGGSRIVNHITSALLPYIPSGTATNIQLTASTGGGAGAKSATGTTAVSGGGGGGGGFVYVASPKITNYLAGKIQANGGAGGDASGTGANLGGGGGGGGGVVFIVTNKAKTTDISFIEALGGTGGTSVDLGVTNGLAPIAVSNLGTVITSNSNYARILPTYAWSKNTIYMLSIVMEGAGSYVDSVYGGDMGWFMLDYVDFNTIGTPTRRLELWQGYWVSPQVDNPVDLPYLEVYFAGSPSSTKVVLDSIQNSEGNVDGIAIASSDSTANITTDLGYVPTTNNMVYSVFARVGGTNPAQGTGQTVITNSNTLPYLYTSVSNNRQTNNHLWTTATRAGAISVDLTQTSAMENGENGWDGKVVVHYV